MKGVGKARGTAGTDVMCITYGSNCMHEHFVLCCLLEMRDVRCGVLIVTQPALTLTPSSLFGISCSAYHYT